MFIQRLRIVTFVGERFKNGWVFKKEVLKRSGLGLKGDGFDFEVEGI